MSLPPTPIIIGPTASGKTALAVDLALALIARNTPAEIITADSMQVYRGMDIGTAKPTTEERRGVPHHLIDIAEPAETFTVHRWLQLCNQLITDLRGRGVLPIVVGGTHLYIKALLDGLFEGPGADDALRERLRAEGLPALRARLEQIDPAAAARIHPNDERRTIRALEVFELTGKRLSEHQSQWKDDASVTSTDRVLIGLDWPTEALNRRINQRVRDMLTAGLLDEVHRLAADTGAPDAALGPTAREGLGYKQLLAHLAGRGSLEDAVEAIKIETRRFAKNQRTWIRRLRITPGSLFIDAESTPRERWVALVLDRLGVQER